MTQQNLFDSKSQCQAILDYLKSGKPISPLEALEKFGCFRLGGRVYDLKKAGWPIKTEMVERNGKRFAQYVLEK